ncbi:MAG: pilus assembly protein PilM [Candidatus Omnitrophica bacterium]|nr:pilus assembly protein PilM [Candidatus Omnitrophota bacterium]
MNLNYSRYICISITPTLVKIAQVSSAGVVEKLAQKIVSNGAIDVAVREALPGFQVAKSGILYVVPGDAATAKSLEVPSADNDEISSILALQAARHTPFNKDEILTSYIKVGSPKPNFTKVLLVIAKRDAVKEHLSAIKSAGLDVTTVLFVPEGIARFYAGALKVKKNDLPFGIIDVNMAFTNLIIQAQGAPVMTRSIPVGIEQLSLDAGASKQLVDEIKASLEIYDQDKVDRKPAKFYMTGNHRVLAGLDVVLAEALAVKVETALYGGLVKMAKGIKEQIAQYFADDAALDVIAPAVVAAKCQAELIPQEMKEKRALAEKGRSTFFAGMFVILILLFIGAGLLSKVSFKDAFLKQNLIQKYSEQKKQVKNLESLIAKTRVVREYLTSRQLPLEAVRELYRIVPQEI